MRHEEKKKGVDFGAGFVFFFELVVFLMIPIPEQRAAGEGVMH